MARSKGAKQHEGVRKKTNQGNSKYTKQTTKVRKKMKLSHGQG